MPGPSGKQRKAQLQLKRAIKRGDAPKPEPLPASKRHRKLRRSPKPGHTLEARQAAEQSAHAARKLQSAFVKLDKGFLEETRRLAGAVVLRRPINGRKVRVLREEWMRPVPTGPAALGEGGELGQLSIPKRPKWKYKMTKAEVDANEQGHFRKWLAQQDAIVERWQGALNSRRPRVGDADDQASTAAPDPAGLVAVPGDVDDSEPRDMPHPPTHFERNLEVWRQLWRVTEISQILLVLLDSRCPPLHLPPSLVAYLNLPTSESSLSPPSNPRRNHQKAHQIPRTILVLTKVDISGPLRTAAWTSFLTRAYPSTPVVPVESYAPVPASHDPDTRAQGRTRYEPFLAGGFRERLVGALREVHAGMVVPPAWVLERRRGKDGAEEGEAAWRERVGRWRPSVRKEVDWEGVMKARGKMVGRAVGGPGVPRGSGGEEVGENGKEEGEGEEGGGGEGTSSEEEGDGAEENEKADDPSHSKPHTGQPNVGKSSLLNALFGTTRVRASRTPGKVRTSIIVITHSRTRYPTCRSWL
ncbi:hypothetical protein HYDPIDRAFT_109291, partial [Hydnomerulius pinastri MD-312]